jgi:membrane protein DedA with SNARE-associated domain
VETWLATFLSKFTYLAIVGVLTAAGVGAPVSEDLVLLLSGALAAKGVTRFWPTLAAGFVGVLIGDGLIHRWGAKLGPKAYSSRLVQRLLSPQRQAQVRDHYARHGMLTVVVGRHTPGLRTAIFFLAGASGLPRWKFLLADAVSAAFTVPVVVTLGYQFAAHLDELRARMHHIEWMAGSVVAAAALVWLFFRWRGKTRRATAAADARACSGAAAADAKACSGPERGAKQGGLSQEGAAASATESAPASATEERER